MVAVDAANWLFPFGYAYRNLLGNVLASVLWAGPPFVAGVLIGKRRAQRTDAHNEWMARHVAEVNAQVTGSPAAPHPFLDM
jgi:hypothetical protein